MKKNYRGIGFYIGLVLIVILVWYLLGNSQDTAGHTPMRNLKKHWTKMKW